MRVERSRHALLTVLTLASTAGAWAPPLFAEPVRRGLDDYTVTTWNDSHGLSSRIMAIEQDRDGYLWVGTDNGLVRFDGVRFQPVSELGGSRLPSGIVTTLLSARDRSVWVGAGRSGIARIHDGQLTSYGVTEGFHGYPNFLLEDANGTVWAASSEGLLRFNGQRWTNGGAGQGIPPGPVLALHVDHRGRFWVATREAVFRRDRSDEPFSPMDVIRISSNNWQAFSEDESGAVWITDFLHGFRRLDDGRAPSGKQLRGWGVKLLHDARGNLWVATRGQGLWRAGRGKNGELVPDVITAKDGLANDAVQVVFEDGEGNIWVGTHAGLQRLTPHKITPLTDLPIARATAATSDGSIWVGTTAGLIRIASGGRRFYQESQGLPGIVVLALTTDSQGDLWVATERALARFAGNRFTTVLEVPAERRIFSIALSDGSLWLRDVNRRLTRVTAEGASLEVDLPEAFRTNVVAVSADRQGRLWIGMSDGRLGLRLPGGVFRSYDARIGNIFAVFEDASGVMWFGGDGGLSRFAHGQLTTLNRLNGLPSGVNSIVEDEDGVLWVGLTSGIARLEKDEIMLAGRSAGHQIRYRLFNSADGAAGIPVAEGSRTAVRTRDGRLWFATSGGVTVVDPHSIGEPRGRVPVQIESVLAGAATFAPAANLELPRRTSHVQFAFTALTLTDSVRVQFQYRLEGLDDKWSDPGTSRQASYTNLAPGQYRFVVRGSNGDGLWSEPVASLNFVIPPMFYQTTWFYGLCVLAVSLLVYGAWWLHVRRVRGEFALVLAERIRMSRAIHDTLLQGLAALALQVDDLSHGLDAPAPTLKERILRLRHRVEDQIREARQSIWDLRSPVLESKPFPEVLRDAARRAIGGRPVSLEFTVRGTPQPCSPAVKEQLLHICQEAVTNAVQHGRPTEVKVDLEYGNHAVRVRVGDDGCGFVPTTGDGTGGHYGVVSMKERAAQVRGRLTIVSAAGRGTEVEAVVPPM